jgi:sugar lactone lactonase YvrE
MNSKGILAVPLFLLGALVAAVEGQGQAPALPGAPAAGAAPVALQTGPGVQAPNDAKYREFVTAKCKNPPAPRAPRGGGGGRGAAATNPDGSPKHRDYKVTAISGVIAEGAMWKTVWTGRGNNADGPVATSDGGMLFAQNTDSKIMKLDKDGKASFPYENTRTSGSVSINKKGTVFVLERALPQDVLQVAPKRFILADKYMGEPLDCTGELVNDMTTDSKGGVYFTMGGVFYADPKGMVTKYGTIPGNGIILSPDEKTLYVTGRLMGVATNPADQTPAAVAAAAAAAAAPAAPAAGRGGGGGGGTGLVAYDVQPDGTLKNERQFSTCACSDGSAVDSLGRIYSTGAGANGVQVLDKNGKFLGEIPTPLPLITVAFSGKDKKTMYGVANTQQWDEIFTIPMIAQGFKGRPK